MHFSFSDGHRIPVLGLGTWTSPVDKVKTAVLTALENGYRHIDGAFVYGNEKAIGEALKEGMKKFNLRREDIFVTSKVWCTYFRPELVRKCCENTLKDLQLSYVDLYLIHWPVALKPGDENFPKIEGGDTLALDHPPLVETWKAMEQLVRDKMVKSIGVSNFNKRQIDMILADCTIKPVNLQVEIHVNFPNSKLVEYAHSKGLTVTAYAPLGSPGASPGEVDLLTAPWVCEIADRHQKTTAQVLLRYLLQRNIIVIPKSVTPARVIENSKVSCRQSCQTSVPEEKNRNQETFG
ncbi:unnamed protein product [Echinostoma caproni]|uniref:Aldo_ket_red domain-containing protein n=1 Tax=Echinostoma caproni TaxID=27848 RepID=A0A183B282_9TREM|nr:unnamed protein product [Echinostoma caproni]